MRNFKKLLIEAFGFSPQESGGFIYIIIILSFFLLSIHIYIDYFYSPDYIISAKIIEGEILKTELNTDQKKEIEHQDIAVMDPNRMDYFDWRNAGLNPGLSNRIISYRLNGGYFNSIEELLDIYGITDSLLEFLQPYLALNNRFEKNQMIEFDKSFTVKNKKVSVQKDLANNENIIFNINACDSTDLQSLKGIGRIRASRIIRYRNNLGGFADKNQFKEIYGMDSLSLRNLDKYCTIDSSEIDKIEINKIGFKELLNHPYCDYTMTKIILNYRDQHGDFKSKKDFNNIYALDQEKLNKLFPYLSFKE